jgi:putative tryptophan/tyrosine transport system substrate-binding protein
VKRREFMTLFGSPLFGGPLFGGPLFAGVVTGWPIAARAGQSRTPVIGLLSLGSPDPSSAFAAAFRAGLSEAGYVPGQNVTIESRWANNQPWLLPELAADLVDRRVDVIVATGSSYTALAAKAASSSIPIVFAIADDPVQNGLVASLNRPGGTLTGMSFLGGELAAKRLALLLELIPHAVTIGFLSGPAISPIYKERKREMLAAGQAVGREIVIAEVRYSDFEAAFTALAERRADALIVGSFTLFRSPHNCSKILELAARHRIAAMYPARQFTDRGGLMSYDSDARGVGRRLGSHYVGQILKGARPADLPVQGPDKFDLIINLNAASALDLVVPRTLLAGATELIN